jgi:DNA processing protein
MSAEDIIETFNISQITSQLENKKILPETKEEELILSFFKEDSVYINDLVRLTKLDTNVINSTLVIMEMKGMIKNIGNAQYILAK